MSVLIIRPYVISGIITDVSFTRPIQTQKRSSQHTNYEIAGGVGGSFRNSNMERS
jgi:hypothetical protein